MSLRRSIYVIEAVIVDSAGQIETVDNDFWDHFHGRVLGLSSTKRSMSWAPGRIGGAAKITTQDDKYLYLIRTRSIVDTPHVDMGDDEETPVDTSGRPLAEPMYIRGIPGTRLALMTKTQLGPSWSALDAWFNQVMPKLPPNKQWQIQQYVRSDTMDLLEQSTGVSMVHVRVAPDGELREAEGSSIGRACAGLKEIAPRTFVEVKMSYARTTPDRDGLGVLKREISTFVKTADFTGAEANVYLEDEQGGERVVVLNFARDRLKTNGKLKLKSGDVPKAQDIMAMFDEVTRDFGSALAGGVAE